MSCCAWLAHSFFTPRPTHPSEVKTTAQRAAKSPRKANIAGKLASTNASTLPAAKDSQPESNSSASLWLRRMPQLCLLRKTLNLKESLVSVTLTQMHRRRSPGVRRIAQWIGRPAPIVVLWSCFFSYGSVRSFSKHFSTACRLIRLRLIHLPEKISDQLPNRFQR